MSNWEHDKTERQPARRETRAAARLGGEVPERPQRQKRNTRRWCRGKVGVEHITEIRMRPHLTHITECGWWPYRQKHKLDLWICREQEVCTACGKILQHSLGDACTMKPKEPA